ncbi:MAG: hypothetical protein ABJB86_24930 [Bacteroidota bacterium]
MKKLLFTAITSCCAIVAFSQADTTLTQRLRNFMEANSKTDLEQVLDYTYPKIFTLIPRAQMLEALKKTFDNEQVTLRFESLKTDSVYPIFKMQEGSYAKIRYSMKMIMRFKSKETDPGLKKIDNEFMLSAMQMQYGKDKVTMDSTGNVIMPEIALMVAVKDKYAREWCFINLKEDDPVNSQLFSRVIIDKLATYK